MSDQDIEAGTNWSERIKRELANTTIGIICMTPENQDARWINYEMGALSKEVKEEENRVIPLLIGFEGPHQVGQPAASLNMVMLGKEGFSKIAKSLNEIAAKKREAAELATVTDLWWSSLSGQIEVAAGAVPMRVPAPRTEQAMVEEILDTVRTISREKLAPSRRNSNESFEGVSFEVLTYAIRSVLDDSFGHSSIEYGGHDGVLIKTERDLTPEMAYSIAVKIRAIHPDVRISFNVLDEEDFERLASVGVEL